MQFYFNGHNWLANRLLPKGIGFTLADNAFLNIDNFDEAQKLADSFSVKDLHRRLDIYTRLCCPIQNSFSAGVHWTIRQIEYAMDIVWSSPGALAPVYDELLRRSVMAVKAVDIAAFLGRRWLGPDNDSEIGSDLKTRIEGTRVKHHMGPSSIKMYNKLGRVLRLETTCNNVSFF